ncbi:hypothetical protein TNIN_472791 [Trichonephila inaurata madagascariensis]|uniref:Uncharacterized protein n=1 Tax=Trichonephila inaurata madagascariensis TaxID=2747483 RepID=A0A8X6WPJ1_9ARAC|nr:hypothetical protein TNIN_472791 [Trichonephila inaurata madagascariensis]
MRPLGRGLATPGLDEGGWSFYRTACHISRVDATISSCRWNWDLGSYLSQQRSEHDMKSSLTCKTKAADGPFTVTFYVKLQMID